MKKENKSVSIVSFFSLCVLFYIVFVPEKLAEFSKSMSISYLHLYFVLLLLVSNLHLILSKAPLIRLNKIQ